MKEGFGWGIGSSIARSMFNNDRPSVAQPVPVTTSLPKQEPESDQLIYNKCMEDNNNNHEMCKQYKIYTLSAIAQSNA